MVYSLIYLLLFTIPTYQGYCIHVICRKKTIQVDQQKLHSSTFMCRLQGLSLTNDFHMILLAHYLTLPF